MKKGTLGGGVRLRTPADVLKFMENAATGAMGGTLSPATLRLVTRIGGQSLRALEMQRRDDAAAQRRAEMERERAEAAERAAHPPKPTFEERVYAASAEREARLREGKNGR